MKNTKTIVRLLIACSLCAVIIALVDRMPNASTPENVGRLIPQPLKEIDRLLIRRPDGVRIEFRRGNSTTWHITRPVSTLADHAVVKELLDAFERAPCFDRIDEEEMELRGLSPADFGADDLKGTLTIQGPRFQLEIGAGAFSALPGELFVFLGRSVCVTTPELLRFFQMPLEAFADTRLFRNYRQRANVITLNRGQRGFVKMVRDFDYREWKITQPCQTRADPNAINDLFQVLYAARIDHYAVGGPSPEGLSPEGLGLDGNDSIIVQIATPEDPVGQVVTIGSYLPRPADQVYVRAGYDGVVGVVTGAVRRAALMSVSDLRDKNLFTFSAPPVVESLSIEAGEQSLVIRKEAGEAFAMTAPVADKASPVAVASLLDSVLRLSASRFDEIDRASWNPSPSATIAISTSAGSYKYLLSPLPADALQEGEEDSFYAVPADSLSDADSAVLTVPVVPASSLVDLFAAAADPRPLLSTMVLSLDSKGIRGITSEGGGVTTSVTRVENEWKAPSDDDLPETEAIGEYLSAVGDLVALRAEALREGENNVYSLSPCSRKLVFDLLDGASPRVVLFLGGRSPDGGVYGRLQGHDVVFVFPESVERVFARPLVAPASSREEPDGARPVVPTPSPRK